MTEVLKLSGKMKVIDLKTIDLVEPRTGNLLYERVNVTKEDLIASLEDAIRQLKYYDYCEVQLDERHSLQLSCENGENYLIVDYQFDVA